MAASTQTLYGITARYENKRDLLAAAAAARQQGYRRMETYTPFPVEELNPIMEYKERVLPWVVFISGLTGGLVGFFMQYGANVWWLQLDIGGRPFNSWPAFIPITFELTVLFAAIAGFLGVLIKCGFLQIYHPMFNASSFDRAMVDSFFLCIMADDPRFDAAAVHQFFQKTGPKEISNVET